MAKDDPGPCCEVVRDLNWVPLDTSLTVYLTPGHSMTGRVCEFQGQMGHLREGNDRHFFDLAAVVGFTIHSYPKGHR